MAYIYIVRCEDDSLYTGITKDIKARMKAHLTGTGKAKYTRSRKIRQLCALWTCESYRDAARLEYAVKTLTRSKKLELIADPESVNGLFEHLSDIHFETSELFDINELQ